MNNVVLSLGSNLGDKVFYLKEAVKLLNLRIGEAFLSSSVYETEAWGMVSDETFYNIVLVLKTEMNPFRLLKESMQIESELGRERVSEGYASRTIDIDILFFNEEIIETNELTIPHLHIQKRNFVLAPLAEILPEFRHPILKMTAKELLEISQDKCVAEKITDVGFL